MLLILLPTHYYVIKDVAVRSNLDLEKLRAFCFDVVSNMNGRLHEVTSLLSSEHSKSMYIHCVNHSLDLVLQEAAKECDIICNALVTVKDITNMIRESSKRRGIYDIAEPEDKTAESVKVTQLFAMCPSRWVIRVAAVRRFLENFHRTRATPFVKIVKL